MSTSTDALLLHRVAAANADSLRTRGRIQFAAAVLPTFSDQRLSNLSEPERSWLCRLVTHHAMQRGCAHNRCHGCGSVAACRSLGFSARSEQGKNILNCKRLTPAVCSGLDRHKTITETKAEYRILVSVNRLRFPVDRSCDIKASFLLFAARVPVQTVGL